MAEKTKRTSQPPKRLLNEYLAVEYKKKKRGKSARDNKLYEIEIVAIDKQKKRVKIHYKGYEEEADEWRDCQDENMFPFERVEKAYIPEEISLEDRTNVFHGHIYQEIKRKLWSGRRDDPEIRIEVNVDCDVFDRGLGKVVKGIQIRGKKVHTIKDNADLDHILGLKWNERIFNENGDFAYVVNGTVQYWLTKRNPIMEFKYIGGKFVRSEIEGLYALVLTFVRGDGNKRQYISRTF